MRSVVVLSLALAVSASAAGFNGVWDAVIVSNGVRVPFRLEVTESPARVCFFEDTQPVCSTSAQIEAGALVAQWDYLNSELHLAPKDDGLAGSFRNRRARQPSDVEARHHQPPAAPARPSAKLGGEWEVHSNQGRDVSWQLLLQQSGADLKGTILRVDGDVGTLVGRIDGAHFQISHFAGDRPTLVEGTLLDDGTLDLAQGRAKLYALRPAEARARNLPPPPDPSTFAKARNSSERFHFSFPDLDGRTFTEKDFAGKPLIVSITGSWCPNCRDEAPFLGELYRRYHPAGLQIVGFCFENADDPSNAPLRAFIRKFAIEYPMLLTGEPSSLRAAVPQIDNIGAFPTSIYVGRDGTVKRVHTGFPSIGSGEELTRVKDELRAVVEQMLAEPASGGDITGTWTAAIDTQIGVQNYTYTFQVNGDKLTGRAKSQFGDTEITEGSVKGDEVSFVENLNFQDQPLRIEYKGKLSGDEIRFTRNVADVATEEFVAKRAK